MNKTLVIYHREDNDGACSAGIADAFLRRFSEDVSVYFEGVNYADLSRYWNEVNQALSDPSEVAKKPKIQKWCDKFSCVIMVDISFNEPDAMEYMYEKFGDRFIWCDHHKPIIEASASYGFGSAPGIRRTDQSALMNTWDFMCDRFSVRDAKPSNEMVTLSDYDSWAWTKKEVYKDKAAQENMFNLNVGMTHKSNLDPTWFSFWVENWIVSGFNYEGVGGSKHFDTAWDAQVFGKQVRELDKKRTDRAVRSNADCTWRLRNGESVAVIFTTERMNSMSFSAVTDKSVKHGSVIKYDAKNDNWTLSLYNFSDEDKFDCGEYLKQWYNGGGHPGAAGCTLTAANVSGMIMSKQV